METDEDSQLTELFDYVTLLSVDLLDSLEQLPKLLGKPDPVNAMISGKTESLQKEKHE
jgi:hypothetical protein